MKNTINRKMFISAFMATVALVLIVAAVFSYTFVQKGYAYWDTDPEGKPIPSSSVDVIAEGENQEEIQFNPSHYFNPSAKYFEYVFIDGSSNEYTGTVTLDYTGKVTLTLNDTPADTDTMSVGIIGYNGNLSDIEIPSSIAVSFPGGSKEEVPVTSVSGINSTNTVGLTSIVIPKTVTNIGANCFSGYRSTLKLIKFQDRQQQGAYTLGAQAFRFSKGANTAVYYGSNRITAVAEITDASGGYTDYFDGSTAFIGWIGS